MDEPERRNRKSSAGERGGKRDNCKWKEGGGEFFRRKKKKDNSKFIFWERKLPHFHGKHQRKKYGNLFLLNGRRKEVSPSFEGRKSKGFFPEGRFLGGDRDVKKERVVSLL